MSDVRPPDAVTTATPFMADDPGTIWRVHEGRVDVFSPEQGFETVDASHRAFADRGVRPVVAIVDTAFGGDEPPGFYANTEEDSIAHCAPESLEVVGTVTLHALETIGRRLAKIDRFSESPLVELESSPESEEPSRDGEAPAGP